MTSTDALRIYRGGVAPHDGIQSRPAPPPWRTFDGPVLEQFVPADEPDGANGNGLRGAAAYLPEEEAVVMANVAMLLRRPLLVTGRPGTGKSTLARSIAYELQLGPVLYWPITSGARLADALYTYDPIGRLHQTNLAKLSGSRRPAPSIGDFLRLGPLGTALVGRHRPRVLLIDELDKSDIDLPNDLLNVLEEGQFEIPELTRQTDRDVVRVATADPLGWADVRHGQVRCNAYPVIVITNNGEREFSPAFRRRLVHVEIQPPSTEKLRQIIVEQLGPQTLSEAPEVFTEFTSARETRALSTDQLLDAMYLTTSGLELDGKARLDVVRRIFRDHTTGEHSQ